LLGKESNKVRSRTNQLGRINTKLKEFDKAKSEFISRMGHELRNPLQMIMLYSESLLGDKNTEKINPEQENIISGIFNSAIKIDTLLNDLLDIQKIELGKLKIFPTYVDVNDLINQNIKEQKLLSKNKEIEIKSDIKTSAKVYCDRQRIDQVLTNLIKNSIDFVPEKNGKIIIRAEDAGNSKVLFTVKDNGIGIPPEEIAKLFTMFYQVDTPIARQYPGSGLGLAICKGIIEQHGEKIWFDKTYSKGVAVKFTLPQKG
jgi:signal transduction histidine kinase